MIEEIREKVLERLAASDGADVSLMDSNEVFCCQRRSVSPLEETLYEPALCLVLQGSKQTLIDGRTLCLSAGDSVLVSHHVPVHARITQASEVDPYIALVIRINMAMIRSLTMEIERLTTEARHVFAVDSDKADEALLETVDRLLRVLGDPLEAQLIGNSILKELHLRMLKAPHGGMLRELATKGSAANNIARAIAFLRKNYCEGLTIADIACEAGMSESSLYQRFREITGATPNQYLKSLRLQAAHGLLLLEDYTVSSAAFAVGYKSPNHFSRDYSRRFGFPPKDAKALAV